MRLADFFNIVLLVPACIAAATCLALSSSPKDTPTTAPIADNLKPYLTDYAVETTLRAGFVPAKTKLVLGEPLVVTFQVENIGQKDFTFFFGGDNRGKGRHDRFKIHITDAKGTVLIDPRANHGDFGGMGNNVTLQTAGKPFTRTIDLSDFRVLAEAGEYNVTCSFAFDESPPEKAPARPVVISRFNLSILDRSPQNVGVVLDDLVAKAKAAEAQDLPAALSAIASFGQSDGAIRIVELTRIGTVGRRIAAIEALPLVKLELTLQAALTGLEDVDPTIRKAAAMALGSLGHERGAKALLSALPQEKSPVAEAIIIALGMSQVDAGFPTIIDALKNGTREMKRAAITSLVAFDHPNARAALREQINKSDTSIRYDLVLALAEKLHEPLNTDWLLPVLMTRDQSHEWHDSFRLLRLYAGERAIPVMCSVLDFDVAWSGRNWWIFNDVRACPNAPPAEYIHDWNREGTPEELEKNLKILTAMKKLAGPIPTANILRKERNPCLKTDPAIDFKAVFTPGESNVTIKSGFYQITIYRNGTNYSYAPSEEWRVQYELAGKVRELIDHPDRQEKLGFTADQARQLRALGPPPDRPAAKNCTMLYMLYKESPTGALQQQSTDELCDAIVVASQEYHAAIAGFAESANKILAGKP